MYSGSDLLMDSASGLLNGRAFRIRCRLVSRSGVCVGLIWAGGKRNG
jgi:hypothetical protein